MHKTRRTRFRLNCRECRFIANSNCRHGIALFVIDAANATVTLKNEVFTLCVFEAEYSARLKIQPLDLWSVFVAYMMFFFLTGVVHYRRLSARRL